MFISDAPVDQAGWGQLRLSGRQEFKSIRRQKQDASYSGETAVQLRADSETRSINGPQSIVS
jgi:hypothetical protein